MKHADDFIALAAMALMAVAFVCFMGIAFAHNLHKGGDWCAHPERPGNALVQPLCD